MRLLPLLVVISLASRSCAAALADTISDQTSISRLNAGVALRGDHEVKRTLRWQNDDDDEDRGLEKVADKVDDTVARFIYKPLRLPSSLKVVPPIKPEEAAAKAKEAMTTYPKGLSSETMRQLEKVEEQRVYDVLKIELNPNGATSKKTPAGMRKEMEITDYMIVAPVLRSHVGRAKQRVSKDGSRLLTCTVVSRSHNEGGGDVLLISSSITQKRDWVLPKGGWNEGEDLHQAAWREVLEKGGVNAAFKAPLGTLKFDKNDDKSYIYHAFKMKGITTYDQWSESKRYRIWDRLGESVSFEDAEKLLAKRPEMVDIVRRAEDAA